MSLFTPFAGLLGGTLIGASAGSLLILNGDIMGISGILTNSLLDPRKTLRDPQYHWRWVWVSSFALAVNFYVNFLNPSMALQDARSEASDVPIPSMLAFTVGGFLVGVGTRIGNGCTSGHGICGISRLSLRSLVATCTFTGMSMLTRALISPLRSWSNLTNILRATSLPAPMPLLSALATTILCLVTMSRPIQLSKDEKEQVKLQVSYSKSAGAAISGALFALGLAISGMTKNSKVHDFLCLSGFSKSTYDPTLIMVMVSGILTSMVSYQMIAGWTFSKQPVFQCPCLLPKGSKFSVPTNKAIDLRLLLGTATFGIGWGMTGICPGPALFAASAGVAEALVVWLPAYLVGSYTGAQVVERLVKSKVL